MLKRNYALAAMQWRYERHDIFTALSAICYQRQLFIPAFYLYHTEKDVG